MERMWMALLGGLLIGVSAALLLVTHGRLAGISGVVGGALSGPNRTWRLWFLAGLIGGGLPLARLLPQSFASAHASAAVLVGAGLLVGFGARLGGGCTSGHGVCGIGRSSLRSILATLTFMATGAATVYVVRHVLQ
jgi:uncharacterized membrane protein YedE/YeeE